MKNITKQLIQGDKEKVLLDTALNNPHAWRIITSYYKQPFVEETELINFFRFTGIRGKYKGTKNMYNGDVITFIKDNLEEFKLANKDKIRPSLLSLERKFIDLQYNFKRVISLNVRYPSYFDVFMKAEPEDIEWIVDILLGNWDKKVNVTEEMIIKIIKEVTEMEYKEDAIICVNMMNKQTNQIVGMDMVVSKEILNTVMKDKVHKEFDKILKDTIGKLSTVKNVNKLLYS